MTNEHDSQHCHKMQSKARWVFFGFILIAGYLLITEHKAHFLGWLSVYGTWLFLLACPLMHMFMHHGHHNHGEHPPQKDEPGDQK